MNQRLIHNNIWTTCIAVQTSIMWNVVTLWLWKQHPPSFLHNCYSSLLFLLMAIVSQSALHDLLMVKYANHGPRIKSWDCVVFVLAPQQPFFSYDQLYVVPHSSRTLTEWVTTLWWMLLIIVVTSSSVARKYLKGNDSQFYTPYLTSYLSTRAHWCSHLILLPFGHPTLPLSDLAILE